MVTGKTGRKSAALVAHKSGCGARVIAGKGGQKLRLQQPVIWQGGRPAARLKIAALLRARKRDRISGPGRKDRPAAQSQLDAPILGIAVKLVALDQLRGKIKPHVGP